MLAENPALFSGPGSITWQVNGEMASILGWQRAILMQFAHPMIAQGIAHHSTFSSSAKAKIQRFDRTLDQMLRLTFGTPREVWETARSIDRIHAHVHGDMPDHLQKSAYAAQYSARYPKLLKWVHATFVDSVLKAYSLYVRPLSEAERDDYVLKASIIGPLFGAPRGYFCESADQLDRYVEAMLSDGTLHVDDQARTLAKYVLDAVPIPLLQRGIAWSLQVPTAALLPPALKEAYGLKHSRIEAALLRSVSAMSRALHRILPARLHRWPLARRAEMAARAQRTEESPRAASVHARG
jgi:uncharacterized protein (DUF2236 family)